MAFLRLPKTVPKSPFEAYLKDILRNLQVFRAVNWDLNEPQDFERTPK